MQITRIVAGGGGLAWYYSVGRCDLFPPPLLHKGTLQHPILLLIGCNLLQFTLALSNWI